MVTNNDNTFTPSNPKEKSKIIIIFKVVVYLLLIAGVSFLFADFISGMDSSYIGFSLLKISLPFALAVVVLKVIPKIQYKIRGKRYERYQYKNWAKRKAETKKASRALGSYEKKLSILTIRLHEISKEKVSEPSLSIYRSMCALLQNCGANTEKLQNELAKYQALYDEETIICDDLLEMAKQYQLVGDYEHVKAIVDNIPQRCQAKFLPLTTQSNDGLCNDSKWITYRKSQFKKIAIVSVTFIVIVASWIGFNLLEYHAADIALNNQDPISAYTHINMTSSLLPGYKDKKARVEAQIKWSYSHSTDAICRETPDGQIKEKLVQLRGKSRERAEITNATIWNGYIYYSTWTYYDVNYHAETYSYCITTKKNHHLASGNSQIYYYIKGPDLFARLDCYVDSDGKIRNCEMVKVEGSAVSGKFKDDIGLYGQLESMCRD